jgi:hypothetical protein
MLLITGMLLITSNVIIHVLNNINNIYVINYIRVIIHVINDINNIHVINDINNIHVINNVHVIGKSMLFMTNSSNSKKRRERGGGGWGVKPHVSDKREEEEGNLKKPLHLSLPLADEQHRHA